MEAEFIGYYKASNQGVWLWNFIIGLCFNGVEKPLKINYNNKAAKLYSKNNKSSSKSKYINIKFPVVKEKVQNAQVSIKNIYTNLMIIDPVTKLAAQGVS